MHRRITLVMAALLLMSLLSRAEADFAMRPGECLTYRIYLAGLALGEERLSIGDGGIKDGRAVLLLEQALDS